MSPGIGLIWSLIKLKLICHAIFYFEDAFEAFVPINRRSNEFAQSNHYDNDILKEKNEEECRSAIDSCNTIDDLVDLMHGGGNTYLAGTSRI